MKLAAKTFLFLIGLATLAFAQTIPHFDHIVVIFQENRTPDNVFGSGPARTPCNSEDPFEPGVDIENCGPNKVTNMSTYVVSEPLSTCIDPNHAHIAFTNQLDLVMGVPQMDGACVNYKGCQPNGLQCPPYTYVQKSDVLPYFNIALNYGFANYMFQTNEGPSFPAHQFIFSGTSGPTEYPADYFDWFDAENMGEKAAAGCIAPSGQTAEEINPSGTESLGYTPPGFNQGYPCYDHPTLIDILQPKGINWKYYSNSQGSIWSAPTAIRHICGAIGQGSCPNFGPNGKYVNNVIFESHNNLTPIFNDIQNCNLAALSWVIPDMRWSDHPETVRTMAPYPTT
jgi:phospholipase C